MLHCGLLGETLGHSYSPMIHHELGDYDYRLFEVPRERLGSFLTSGSWDGLNVTIPYKKAVVPYCTGAVRRGSEAAKRQHHRPPAGRHAVRRQHRSLRLSLYGAPQWDLCPPERRRWCWAAAVHPLR